jgi:hypothetical protein
MSYFPSVNTRWFRSNALGSVDVVIVEDMYSIQKQKLSHLGFPYSCSQSISKLQKHFVDPAR